MLFDLKAGGTNVRTEILAGITTFVSSMYIIVVNPSLVAASGMPFAAVLTGTVILSAFCTLMMGLYARNPILVAPAMGLNVFFTYYVVNNMGVSYTTALGALFWAGVIFLILSVFNVRVHIVRAIPRQLRYAIASGIGIFIALLGFVNSGLVVIKEPFIGLGNLQAITLIFLAGMLVTSVLAIRRVPGALILGIVITTLLAIPVGRWIDADPSATVSSPLVVWKGFYAAPDFSLMFKADLAGSLHISLWYMIFAVLFTDLFDSLSTFVGVAEAANLTDANGEPRNIKQSLIVDAVATGLAGLLGTTSGTAFVESAAGVAQGGRTGLTAVVAGLLFIPFMFFSPLLSVVPTIATAPALIIVGVFMMKPVLRVNWLNMDDAIPCFLAMMLIPFTYSITNGIIWGLLSWTFLKIAARKYSEVTWPLIIMDILCVILLIIER